MAQLKLMKDFYLLGRGELFLAFIDKANHLLQSTPILTTEHGAFSNFAVNIRSYGIRLTLYVVCSQEVSIANSKIMRHIIALLYVVLRRRECGLSTVRS